MHTKIENIEHLKELCKGREQLDCFILLKGGLRSSKTLLLSPERPGLFVFNDIDASEEEFEVWEDLFDEKRTTIGKAITMGAFYVHSYEKVR